MLSDRYHGEGQLTLASGFRYSGTFMDGLPHGLGVAVYPGGSTFNGPYETGRKHGSGGNYVCGVTGICWVGEWAAGDAVAQPSKWSIEPDGADERDQAMTNKPGAKADKGGGKKGGKASKKDTKEPEMGDVEKQVVAAFNGDGEVAGLWCHCVRDKQVRYPLKERTPSIWPRDASQGVIVKCSIYQDNFWPDNLLSVCIAMRHLHLF